MPAKKKLERKTRKLKRLCKRSTESAIIFGRKMFNLERRTEHPGTVSDNCARIFFGHVSEVGKLSFVDNRNTAFWSRKRIHFPRFISFIFRSNKKNVFTRIGIAIQTPDRQREKWKLQKSRPRKTFLLGTHEALDDSNNDSRSTSVSDEWQMKCGEKEEIRERNQITQRFPLAEIYVCHPSRTYSEKL